MRKSESNLVARKQYAAWYECNRDPGTLPCVPVVLINSLCGEKTGIVINLAKGMSLADTLKLLKVAAAQVEHQMGVESN